LRRAGTLKQILNGNLSREERNLHAGQRSAPALRSSFNTVFGLRLHSASYRAIEGGFASKTKSPDGKQIVGVIQLAGCVTETSSGILGAHPLRCRSRELFATAFLDVDSDLRRSGIKEFSISS
jgi:hypothetical protein